MVIPELKEQSRAGDGAATTRTPLAEVTADRLAESVRTGVYAEGERLPSERQLVIDLGVSRIVVREALKVLAERGLIEVRPGVGSFVTALDAAVATRNLSQYINRRRIEPEHLFEIRRLLEPTMAAQAARNADPEMVEAMRGNLQRTYAVAMRLGAADAQVEAFAWADLEFHQLIAAATGNPLYEVLLNPLLDNLLELRRQGVKVAGSARQAFDDHRRIYERIAAGDSSGARRAMLEHLGAVESWVDAVRVTVPTDPDEPNGSAQVDDKAEPTIKGRS